MRQIIITLPDESQILVTTWPDADTEVEWRKEAGDPWQPVDTDRVTIPQIREDPA